MQCLAPEVTLTVIFDMKLLFVRVQTNQRPEAKQFAVETLELLQKLCPMSMAVTLRHFAAVYHAVRTGVLAAALNTQWVKLELVFVHGFHACNNTIRPGSGLKVACLHDV